jgi:hypothetical protein
MNKALSILNAAADAVSKGKPNPLKRPTAKKPKYDDANMPANEPADEADEACPHCGKPVHPGLQQIKKAKAEEK